MGLVSTVVQFVGRKTRLMESAFPDHIPPCHPTSAGTSGPANHVSQSPSRDGLAQLRIQRELLLSEAQRLRNLRRSKAVSTCEAELHAVTHHIMWLEARK
jgi:hypothetical protein